MQKCIAVVGGDNRSVALVEILRQADLQVRGFFILDEAEREALSTYLSIADAAVLPANHLGGDVNGVIPQATICTALCNGTHVYTGKADGELLCLANANRLHVREFLRDEPFQRKNAALTAEGAIAMAIQNSEKTLLNAACVVTGSGRIAWSLLHLLRAFTPNIAMVARDENARIQAELLGYAAYSLDCAEKALRRADYVWNTIPQHVLCRDTLHAMRGKSMYIELASKPGGCDAADIAPWTQYLPAPGVPGKLSPATASNVMAEFVLRDMEVGCK